MRRENVMKRHHSDVARQVHFVRRPKVIPVLPIRSDDMSISSSGDDTIISMISDGDDSSQITECHSNLSPNPMPPAGLSSSTTQVLTRIRNSHQRTLQREMTWTDSDRWSQEERIVSPIPTASPSNERRPRNPRRSRRSFRSYSPSDSGALKGHSSFPSSVSPSTFDSASSPRAVTLMSSPPRYGRVRKATKGSSRRSSSPVSNSNSWYGNAGRSEQPNRPLRRRLRTETSRILSPGVTTCSEDRVPFQMSPRSAQSVQQRSAPNLANLNASYDATENDGNTSLIHMDHIENGQHLDPFIGQKLHRRSIFSRSLSSKPARSLRDPKKSRSPSSSPMSSSQKRASSKGQGPNKQIILQLAQAKWNWNG
ncbi:unnamed protein product [Cylindrotheca closterium]|uniref:Uncharacterized protein n=1 Tax=Cylindrotheca closterium TaxID=2856 RepID=A0AAD2CKB0_9STRA|nr:unnamed protein product [Cylindrotheca closterium]